MAGMGSFRLPMSASPLRTIGVASAVAGTLDILSAFAFAGMAGKGPEFVLRYVASGPFGDRALTGSIGWAAAGLAVHYAIMAVIAAVYVIAARRSPAPNRNAVAAGLIYGLLVWGVMYWIVKPLRWPGAPLPHTLWGIGNALFSHCLLVGVPIAVIARARGQLRPT